MRQHGYQSHSDYGAVPSFEKERYSKQIIATSPKTRRVRQKKPYFTHIVFFACMGMFLYTMYYNGWKFEDYDNNPMIGPSLQTLLSCGAKDTSLIQNGEYWRLISSCFLHAGVVHLLINMAALLSLGVPLELDFGTQKMAMIYLISGLASTILSCLFLPNQLSVGASGAIFGIFGSNWSILLQNWGHISGKYRFTCSLVVLTLLNLALGLLPFVDNFAHIGGFVCGFLLGMMLVFEDRNLRFGISCRQQTWLALGVGTTALALTTGLFVLLSGHDLTEWCPRCSELNCIEFDWAPWDCKDDMIACGYSLNEGNGEVLITCPNGDQHNFCCVNINNDDSEVKDELSTICKNLCG